MVLFDTPQQAAGALALQCWVVTNRVSELVRTVFGSDGASVPFPLGRKSEWRVAHRVDPNLPLGPPSGLVVLTGPHGSAVEVAMGSQASASAPSDRIRTWTVSFGDSDMAVFDARCWFRPKTGQVTASLWLPQSLRPLGAGPRNAADRVPGRVLPSGTKAHTYIPE
jgi:hypothetical protein